jgi:pimeloyl-ACP methyl ester carboxylesterase
MVERLPQAFRIIIANVGHAPHLEAPAQFDRIVTDWILGQPKRTFRWQSRA